MRIDRHTPGTRLDRLVTQKASEALNAMPRRFRPTRSSDVQIRAFRRTEGVPRAGTSTCSGLAARWGSELVIVLWTDMTKSAQPFGHYRVMGVFAYRPPHPALYEKVRDGKYHEREGGGCEAREKL